MDWNRCRPLHALCAFASCHWASITVHDIARKGLVWPFRVAIAPITGLAHDGSTGAPISRSALIGWAALLVAHANEDTIQRRSGLRMPANGLGTCCRKTARGQPIIDATKEYLRLGQPDRHGDGRGTTKRSARPCARRASSGEDVWITSKLASGTVNSPIKGYRSRQHSAGDRTSYLDLVLIHSPKMGQGQGHRGLEGAHRREEGRQGAPA